MGFHQSSSDGVPQRVNNPRFSSATTRRAQSFKRNNGHHEIDLQMNSPRSEIVSNTDCGDGFDSNLERKQAHHHVSQRAHGGVVKGFLRKPVGSVFVDLGLKERKKLRRLMFFVFCGMCLYWGVLKICVNGWFGYAIEQFASNQVRTAKVSNVSLGASEQDIRDFFSFSGEVEHVELHSENERSQVAYVTLKDSQGAETAVLLSGATIVDRSVTIDLAPDYKIPAAASRPQASTENKNTSVAESVVQKAEDVVSGMLAKGFILGKDALQRAKAFDEKIQFTSTASAKVATLDQKIGFTDKISAGTSILNGKVKEMDDKFQVSEKTKTAIATAEQTVSSAGSAIMKNRYILTGTSWVTGAFNKVAKAAGEVGQKTKEKMNEEEHGSDSPKPSGDQPSKPAPAQGLIL